MKKIFAILILVTLIGLSSATRQTAFQHAMWNGYPEGQGRFTTGPEYGYVNGGDPAIFYYPMYDPYGNYYAQASYNAQYYTWQVENPATGVWMTGQSQYNPYARS